MKKLNLNSARIGPNFRNRFLYGTLLLLVFSMTYFYGGEMLYMAMYILLLLPMLSYILTFLLLRGLRVTQSVSKTIFLKGETGVYTIKIKNYTPIMFTHINCQFVQGSFSVATAACPSHLYARPFKREAHDIPFHVKYRGEYPFGLDSIQVRDITGLYTLKRRLCDSITLTVLPGVTDLSYFPLANNLFSQSRNNFEIREEDYAIVSDLRPYLPSDSIKRVHWKLTAKKSEWLVKVFQTNTLSKITVILDTAKFYYAPELNPAIEDGMVEFSLGLIHYCLLRAIPVELTAGGIKKEGRNQSDFDGIYHMAAAVPFDRLPQNALTALSQCIDESQHYINVIIVTAKPDAYLYERITDANHQGHFVALAYCAPPEPDAVEEEAYRLLIESGAACYRLTAVESA